MHGKQKLFYVVSHSRKCSGPQNFWYQCTFACSNPLSGVFIILHKRSNLIIGHPVHKKKKIQKTQQETRRTRHATGICSMLRNNKQLPIVWVEPEFSAHSQKVPMSLIWCQKNKDYGNSPKKRYLTHLPLCDEKNRIDITKNNPGSLLFTLLQRL